MAWLVQLPSPTSATLPVLSIIAPRECILCAALYANFKAHLCGATDDVGDEKPKKEEKQQKKRGTRKSLHNLANKQASKSQQTAGIVLLSLLATDARYLKTLKHTENTPTHTHTHDAYATRYMLQAKPALLSVVSLRVIKSK